MTNKEIKEIIRTVESLGGRDEYTCNYHSSKNVFTVLPKHSSYPIIFNPKELQNFIKDYIQTKKELEIKEIIKQVESFKGKDMYMCRCRFHQDKELFTVFSLMDYSVKIFTLKEIKKLIKDIKQNTEDKKIKEIIRKLDKIGASENLYYDCEFHEDKQLFTIHSCVKTTIYTMEEIKKFIKDKEDEIDRKTREDIDKYIA